jgi:hypothetical protein
MKCKYCSVTKPNIKELKLHFSDKHKEEYEKFNKEMRTWDALHEHEMGSACPICAHRKSGVRTPTGD